MKSFLNRIIDFNYKFKIKFKLLFPVLILIAANLILLKYSSIDKSSLFDTQIKWVFIGSLIYFFISYVRIDFLYQNSYKFYFTILLLLIITLLFGSTFNNSQRWLSIGFLFQPSEVGKLLFIFFIAKFLSNPPKKYNDFKIVVRTLIPTLLLVFLIFKQPDLGTALVYLFIIFPMLIWGGVKPLNILIIISPIISFLISFTYEFANSEVVDLNETFFFILFALWILFIAFVLIKKYRKIISDRSISCIIVINLSITMMTKLFIRKLEGTYWIDRIIGYLDPIGQEAQSAWQINRSYDAIGSGGLTGKGLGDSLLTTEFKMMPIYESDFIVATLGEQFGLVGIFILLALLGYFFYWLITYLDKCMNKYEQLILVGFTSLWFFHSFVNLFIVSGIFPVTGLPFPFLSYGGTHFLTNCIMLAIANKIISSHVSN